MKAADISDKTILDILIFEHLYGEGMLTYAGFYDKLPQFPKKIVHAKLQQMLNKGRLAGDLNGGGNFRLTPKQMMEIPC